MPVSNIGETTDENSRKLSSSFSIDSIIGRNCGKSDAAPRSRSPSSSPTERVYPIPHSLPLNLPHAPGYQVAYAATLNRTLPYSNPDHIHLHHQQQHQQQRNLASMRLLNPSTLPPLAFVHPSSHPVSQLHHTSAAAAAQFHSAFYGSHRDAHIFPWLLGRTDHIFAPRFSGHETGLFLQPFRKAKRIRTAFSPSQLLKLEQSFDKNHYVVGQERKELASKLSLTETQVKVWFQNRRTKYKRLKYEEGGDNSPLAGTSAQLDEEEDDDDVNDDNDNEEDNTTRVDVDMDNAECDEKVTEFIGKCRRTFVSSDQVTQSGNTDESRLDISRHINKYSDSDSP